MSVPVLSVMHTPAPPPPPPSPAPFPHTHTPSPRRSAGDVVLAGGSLGSVSAQASGTGGVYISGVNDTVQLALAGTSSAYIQPASNGANITGGRGRPVRGA